MTPIPFGELKVGQRFRNIVDAEHVVRMKMRLPRDWGLSPVSPNCVQIEGPYRGQADYYVFEAMVFPIEGN